MNECSKATARRKNDPRFVSRWIVGNVVDVGCGDDPIKKEDWPKVVEVVPYDQILGHKDATFLPELGDRKFDAVLSSHCLEHLPNPRAALTNWLRVLKPGGFIVCAVPDEFLYECGRWPSPFNPDHKVSFTLRAAPALLGSINLGHLLWKLPVDVELISLLTEGWDPTKFGQDQTLLGAEASIEFVVRKRDPNRPW